MTTNADEYQRNHLSRFAANRVIKYWFTTYLDLGKNAYKN